MDGFRWDYFEKTETPNFDEIIKGGSKSKALIPVFPTKTFPNHISIVTGLYPENHGIIANRMYDPIFDEYYYSKFHLLISQILNKQQHKK